MKQDVKRAAKLLLKDKLRKKQTNMSRKDRCCAGICNNDRRYPNKLEIKMA